MFFMHSDSDRDQASEGGEGELVVVFEETSTLSTALPVAALPLFFRSSPSSAGTLSFENIAPADLEMTAAPAAAQAIMPRTV